MPTSALAHDTVLQLAKDTATAENTRAMVAGEGMHKSSGNVATLLEAKDKKISTSFKNPKIGERIEQILKNLHSDPSSTSTPQPPPATPETLDFNTGPITFPDPTPVNGWAHLTLRKNGNYEFSGHFHDSGAPSYDVGLGWLIVGNDGTGFSFIKKVHLNGTFEVGPRDGDWGETGNNPGIAAHWNDLVTSNHWRWQANVNWDWSIIVKQIEDSLKVAGTIVGAVIAVVALF